MISIAVILPDKNRDYLADSLLDGFRSLEHTKEYNVRISPRFISVANYSDWELNDDEFINFAKSADLIIFVHAKYTTKNLVEKIGLWDKTVCVDGSEFGWNNRFDFKIQKGLLTGEDQISGRIQKDLLSKCRKYFRREKPYINGILPLPFGIERRFIKYKPGIKKDMDFVCIFGQDEYPMMRRYAAELLESYCKKNGLKFVTAKTNSLLNRDFRNTKSQEKFHELLARAKVGVSVGGGGFDTLRFWEILANNCILLTESLDIYDPDSSELDYKRVFQFKNLFDFEYRLRQLGEIIKSGQAESYLDAEEYNRVIDRHSTAARVRYLVSESLKNK